MSKCCALTTFQVASALSSQDDLRIRRALDQDDADIDRLLGDIIYSDIDTKAVMQLKGIDAEQFLTVTYSVCASPFWSLATLNSSIDPRQGGR